MAKSSGKSHWIHINYQFLKQFALSSIILPLSSGFIIAESATGQNLDVQYLQQNSTGELPNTVASIKHLKSSFITSPIITETASYCSASGTNSISCSIYQGQNATTPNFSCDVCPAYDSIVSNAPSGLPAYTTYSYYPNPFQNLNGTALTIYTNYLGETPTGTYLIKSDGYDQTNGAYINPINISLVVSYPACQ